MTPRVRVRTDIPPTMLHPAPSTEGDLTPRRQSFSDGDGVGHVVVPDTPSIPLTAESKIPLSQSDLIRPSTS